MPSPHNQTLVMQACGSAEAALLYSDSNMATLHVHAAPTCSHHHFIGPPLPSLMPPSAISLHVAQIVLSPAESSRVAHLITRIMMGATKCSSSERMQTTLP